MKAHELAGLLLSMPDLPVAVMAHGHEYLSTSHRMSHGPLQIGTHISGYGEEVLTIGDMLDQANSNNYRPFTILHSGREAKP